MSIKVYKGSDKDMRCKGMQYKLNETMIVDDKRIKADTWYKLEDGEFVEVDG